MLIVRLAQENDIPRVHQLIADLAAFEREPQEIELSISQLLEDGFCESPKYNCFVAEIKNDIVGMALVYPRYSTWKGTVLHLEDLIVDENHRGQGIGTQLLDKVVEYGHQLGVKRISWEVLDWNEPAIAFYEKKGAKVMRDWDVVQLNQNGIEEYLKSRQ